MLAASAGSDPVEWIEAATRALVIEAVERGWSGPPYDPLELAHLLGIPTRPRVLRNDAQVVLDEDRLVVEFNPQKPAARLRFSVAHEIGHTLFPDAADEVRRRTAVGAVEELSPDDIWQLEALCNIAAAEILMPTQTLRELGVHDSLEMRVLLEARRHLGVSIEALLRRVVLLASVPASMFVAHRPNDLRGEALKVIYVEHSPAGETLSDDRAEVASMEDCSAIGQVVTADTEHAGDLVRIEGVGVPPHPGRNSPRVVGLARLDDGPIGETRLFREVVGDLFMADLTEETMVLHVISDRARQWRGPFADRLKSALPDAEAQFRDWAKHHELPFDLGQAVPLNPITGPAVCCLVAQQGYGDSTEARIRYLALQDALADAFDLASEMGVTIRTPAIGSGQAGGHWPIIRDMLLREAIRTGIDVTVHHLREIP